jgi:hypothetical protein
VLVGPFSLPQHPRNNETGLAGYLREPFAIGYNPDMPWWQQPFFQISLPIILTVSVTLWLQHKGDQKDALKRRLNEIERRLEQIEREQTSTLRH